MHGSGRVELRGFFDQTHHSGLKKKIQPNPTHHISPSHRGGIEPMGWTILFITIIIKLRKKYKYKYIKKKNPKFSIDITP